MCDKTSEECGMNRMAYRLKVAENRCIDFMRWGVARDATFAE